MCGWTKWRIPLTKDPALAAAFGPSEPKKKSEGQVTQKYEQKEIRYITQSTNKHHIYIYTYIYISFI